MKRITSIAFALFLTVSSGAIVASAQQAPSQGADQAAACAPSIVWVENGVQMRCTLSGQGDGICVYDCPQ